MDGMTMELVNGLFHWVFGGKETPVTTQLTNSMAYLSVVFFEDVSGKSQNNPMVDDHFSHEMAIIFFFGRPHFQTHTPLEAKKVFFFTRKNVDFFKEHAGFNNEEFGFFT